MSSQLRPLICLLALYIPLVPGILIDARATEKPQWPNILWITAEDMSPTLGCYGDEFATTPHIDQLAAEGVRYTRAFATAPVCSPSRSCLITGCYAPSLGTHQMRSAFPIPKHMTGFPALLRDAGYYTSNNVKTDYNNGNWDTIIQESWNACSDTAHWRQRRDKSQPFFAIFNLMESHQSRSMVWPYERFKKDVQGRLSTEDIHAAADVPLPPYYPDTPVVRKTVARFYDCVTAMDQRVGTILSELEADGLVDNTIVFFYSDHGSGMPRHKRALLDSGMHVPLIIRFPKKYAHLATGKPGSTVEQLVSFVDFGPTVLNLAGTKIPSDMQGQAFLGSGTQPARKYVFGHRDRVDEVRDMTRSVRDDRYLLIRNYMPHLGYNQPTAWPDLGEIRHEFYPFATKPDIASPLRHFVTSRREPWELYDCVRDPQNLNNLASAPQHQDTLQRLKVALAEHMQNSLDLGVLPESELLSQIGTGNAWDWARKSETAKQTIALAQKAANLVGTATRAQLLRQLTDESSLVRYWAAIGLATEPSLSANAQKQIAKLLDDESAAVRIEAASLLLSQAARADLHVEAQGILARALEEQQLTTVLHAARNVEMLGSAGNALVPAMQKLKSRIATIRPADTPATVVQPGDIDLAMFIGFSVDAFLEKQSTTSTTTSPSFTDWQSLFDGQDLSDWQANVKGDVKAVDGEIQILSKGKNLWLLHAKKYSDFELTVEAMMPNDSYNSGIGFRCTSTKGKPRGYQCELEEQKSGMVYAIGSGWVWPKNAAERKDFDQVAKGAFQHGKWNTFRIRCIGDHIQIWVNDTKTTDLRDKRFASGHIALQHHGKGSLHRFRNIKIRVPQE